MFRRGSFFLLSLGILACSETPEESPTLVSQGQTLQNVVVEDLRNSIGFQGFDFLPGKATASSLSLGWDISIDYSGTLQFYPTTTAKGVSAGWSYSATPMLMRGTTTYETTPATHVIQDAQGLHLTHNRFVQHFESKGEGLHWRFTVPERLAGDAALTMRIVTPKMEHRLVDGKIKVIHEDTTWFEWSTFRAWDAQGKDLPLKVRVDGHSMALEIDDRSAMYPIEIDPVASTPFWSVIAPDSEAGGRLGGTVKLIDANGDGFVDALVGQPRYASEPGQENEGRVLLFAGSGVGLSSTASWTFESNLASALLGNGVSLSNDVNGDGVADFVVTAPGWNDVPNALNGVGAVYVFHGGATPALTTTLFGSEQFEFFGISSAGEGDINCDGNPDLIVGSLFALTGAAKVFVYHGNGTSYSNTPAEVFTGGGTENLGASLAIVGDINNDACDDLAVGSPGFSGSLGRVQVYLGSAVSLQTPVVLLGTDSGGQLGASVSGAGDVNNDGFADVIVGAPLSSRPGLLREGSVRVYYGSAIGLGTTPTILRGEVAEGRLGTAVSNAGDVNNDGIADIVVGARQYSNVEGSEGRAVVYQGTAAGIYTTPTWMYESNRAGALFGQAVHGGADVNGDGFDDLLIGAQGYPSQSAAAAGAVFAFAGGPDCFIGGEFLAPGSLNPANPCEVCNPAVSQTAYSNVADATVCDDGDLCTTASACQAGVCVGTAAVDCSGFDSACEVGVCDSATGLCEAADRPAGTTCEDGLFCTVNELCDGAGACVVQARDCSSASTECFDGVACDEAADACIPANPTSAGSTCGGDVCVTAGTCDGAGTCSGEAPLDCSGLDGECAAGVCNLTTGACEATSLPNDTTCDDGDLCSTTSVCQAGVCLATAQVDCSGSDTECAIGVCNSATGACDAVGRLAGTTCDDGLFCTINTTCDGTGLCLGAARDCSSASAICFDGVACDEISDLCIPANPTAAGTTCGGDLCIAAGACDGAGTCSGEATVDCSNLDSTCIVGACNPATGVCETEPVADGTTCDDSDLCTEATICNAGVCGGTAVTCPDDANECTAPACDPGQGCIFEDVAFGTACSITFCSQDAFSVSGGVCDGLGACSEDTTTIISCAPYVCGVVEGEAGCLTACEGDEDCQGDLVCENAACVEPMQGDEDPDMGEPDMGEPDMGEPDMGEDVGPTDMGEDSGPEDAGKLEGSGCSCSTTNGNDSSWMLVFALGLIGFMRRRF